MFEPDVVHWLEVELKVIQSVADKYPLVDEFACGIDPDIAFPVIVSDKGDVPLAIVIRFEYAVFQLSIKVDEIPLDGCTVKTGSVSVKLVR